MSRFEVDLTGSRLEKVGNEGIEIVQVSSFFKDSDAVTQAAKSHEFSRINPHYPGVRAPVEPELLDQLCGAVARLADVHFGKLMGRWTGDAWYSIVTNPPASLKPLQRFPHFDGFDDNLFAVMVYVNHSGHGGTAFYRQKSTGFETITEERFPIYKEQLEADVRANGLPPARYFSEGAAYFDKIVDLGAAYNSLILYPGKALHSGVIDNALPLPSDPESGRLTINGFFRPA
ncbi:MAG: DUF6445 family protein [Henriciella sp.]